MDHLIESMVQETFQRIEQQASHPETTYHGFSYTFMKNGPTIILSLYSDGREGEHFFTLPYLGAYSVLFEQFNQQIFYHDSSLSNHVLDWWSLKKIDGNLLIKKEKNINDDQIFHLGPLGDFNIAMHFFKKIPSLQFENGSILIPLDHPYYNEIYLFLTKGQFFDYKGDQSVKLYLSERAIIRLFWLEIQQKINSLFH